MSARQSPATYAAGSVRLHWVLAALMLAGFFLGQYMTGLRLSPTKLQLFSYHKWLGVTVFLLAIVRAGWRLTHATPAPVAMPRWQHVLAEATHRLLYVLMFAIPLTGWLMSSAKGYQTVYLGLLPIPDLLAKNVEQGDLLAGVHGNLNLLLAVLVLAHAGAALKHHFIDRDGVLRRMVPFLSPR